MFFIHFFFLSEQTWSETDSGGEDRIFGKDEGEMCGLRRQPQLPSRRQRRRRRLRTFWLCVRGLNAHSFPPPYAPFLSSDETKTKTWCGDSFLSFSLSSFLSPSFLRFQQRAKTKRNKNKNSNHLFGTLHRYTPPPSPPLLPRLAFINWYSRRKKEEAESRLKTAEQTTTTTPPRLRRSRRSAYAIPVSRKTVFFPPKTTTMHTLTYN